MEPAMPHGPHGKAARACCGRRHTLIARYTSWFHPLSFMNPSATKSALRLAARLEQVGFSDIVQIRNKVMELRSQGRQVHQFKGGKPFFPTPEHIKLAMDQAL